MPRKPQPWFRFYVETFGDRKIRRLTPAERWVWCAILGAARESPEPGRLVIAEGVALTLAELAEYADVDRKQVKSGVEKMLKLGMVHLEDKVLAVTNWPTRQYQSDQVTARTQAHRERSKTVPSAHVGTFRPSPLERSGNGRRNGPETETEPETEPESSLKRGGHRNETLRASLDTEPPACTTHPHGDSDLPCIGCARVRQWRENEPARAHATRLAAIHACPACDVDGWHLAPDGQPTTTRCTHGGTP